MSDNLSELLVDLASDPDRMAAFQNDPERVFDDAGLNRRQRAVVQSRDPRLLSRTIAAAMRLQEGHEKSMPPKKKGARKPPVKKGGKKKGGKKR